MEKREKFSSRLGFILISAGCAVGLGNVWRFPYITGKYGGAAFVLIYLVFLVILGLPIMVMEFSVGRASQKSAARSFHVLEPKGSKWHFMAILAIAGNYLLMMFYTTVGGWMLAYVVKMIRGEFTGLDDRHGNHRLPRMQPRPAEGCGTRNQIHDGFPVCYPDHPLYQKRYPARRSRRRALLPDT